MTKVTRHRPRKIADIKRDWVFLHKPNPAEHVFRIHELWFSAFNEADIMAILKFRQMDPVAVIEADYEMGQRLKQFMRNLVNKEKVDELLSLLRKHQAGFGGYEVLKLFVPACRERIPPTQRVFTLFTPLGKWHAIRDFFFWAGFRITHSNADTLEQGRSFYGDTIDNAINMHSVDGKVFVDIIESVNEVAYFPAFRMATTLHMHCLFADSLYAPYGSLSCQQKGIINPVHATGEHLLTIHPRIQDVLDKLQKTCVVELHRNPRKLSPHPNKCGIDPHCLHTVRSTASPGSVIYNFRREELTNNDSLSSLPQDGIVWRLGGWSCYPNDTRGLQPILTKASHLHRAFNGDRLAHMLEGNTALLKVLGWD